MARYSAIVAIENVVKYWGVYMKATIIQNIALIIDIVAMSLVLGATAWFFFIQSPVLYKLMVRERFVPVQMHLSKVLFTTLFITLAILIIAAAVQTSSLVSLSTLTAFFAFLAAGINKFLVFPTALRAGGESHKLQEDHGETGTPSEFVSEGAGRSATRMHRIVVLFVLLMVASLISHAIFLIT